MQSGPESAEQAALLSKAQAMWAHVEASETRLKRLCAVFAVYVVIGFIGTVYNMYQGPRPIPSFAMYLFQYFMVSIQLGVTGIILFYHYDRTPNESWRKILKEQAGLIVILMGMCLTPLVAAHRSLVWIAIAVFLIVGAILTVFRLKQIKREYLARHAANDKFTSTATSKLGNSP